MRSSNSRLRSTLFSIASERESWKPRRRTPTAWKVPSSPSVSPWASARPTSGTRFCASRVDSKRPRSLDRPALTAALSDLDVGRGNVLMVSKLDRLTRSVHDATGLMLRAERSGWGLVALDVAVDTTTPQGAAMAQVLAVFAELERRLIGERTKAALAVKRSQGVRLGREPRLPDKLRDRILRRHSQGAGWSQIARDLNRSSVPTAQGGRQWHPATVRYVVVGDERRRTV